MILCRECGNSAPSSDGFCSSCGALLDWAGERVETRQNQAPLTPPPIAPPTQRSTVSFNTEPLTAPPTTVPPPVNRLDPDGRHPTPEARRNDPVPLESEPEFTGPYCAACGTRNPEGRQFCRACGSLLRLDGQPAERRRRWWQRIFRRRGGYAAGERPGGFRDHSDQAAHGDANAAGRKSRRKRHFTVKLGKLAPLFIVAGLAGVGLGPARAWTTDHIFNLFGKAKAKLSLKYVNVTPVGATANAEKDHAAGLAIDGLTNTYWASTQHPDGVGDTITVTFAKPVDIDQIGLLSGADPSAFNASARPHDLTVVGGGPGASGTDTLTFDDSADFQNRPVVLRHVSSITFTVKDSYPGQQKHDLAIREIQFFVLSAP